MTRPPYFPMMINLQDKLVLVVGGGHIATRRAETLLKCAARIVAISPEFLPDFPKAAHRITRLFTPEDIKSYYALVIAATNNRQVNSLIHSLAKSMRIPVNVCDCQDECDFFFPSLITHDNISVSVCSAGISASLTRKLSDKLRRVLASWITEINSAVL